MKPIEKLEPWHYYGEYSIHASDGVKLKINELIDAVNELIPQDLDCKQGGHDKCYSIFADCTYPSTRYWICRVCGKHGADTEPFININEYDDLVKKFKEVK